MSSHIWLVLTRRGLRLVKIEIFDFWSALNTIQPLLLRQKLRAIQPDNTKVSWIIDYLTDRPQFVPSWSSVLDLLQRGSVLSPSLFTLYLWLETQQWVMPSPDFLWWFLHFGMHPWDRGGDVCKSGGKICSVQGGPSAAEHSYNEDFWLMRPHWHLSFERSAQSGHCVSVIWFTLLIYKILYLVHITHFLSLSLKGFACWVKLCSVRKHKAHLNIFTISSSLRFTS